MTQQAFHSARSVAFARHVLVVFAIAAGITPSAPQAQQDAEQVAPFLRVEVVDVFVGAQLCLDEGDLSCAFSLLDELSVTQELNTYETAELQMLYGSVHVAAGELREAIDAYQQVLALPPDELPTGIIGQASQNVAVLRLQLGPPLALRGIYRFGGVYQVSLQVDYGSVHSVAWESGQNDAVPVANGFLLEGVAGRTVTLGLPDGKDCQEDYGNAGTCIGASRIALSVSD